MLVVPRVFSELDTMYHSAGMVTARLDAPPDVSRFSGGMFLSPGDDLRFGYLYQVPQIKIEPAEFKIDSQGNFLSSVSNVKNVAEGSIDYSGSGPSNALSGEAKLDYPNIGVNPLQIIRSSYPDIANTENVAQARVMDAHPGRQVPLSRGQFGFDRDEMSLSYVFSRRTLLASAQWGDEMPAGEVLFVSDLAPNPLLLAASAGTDVQPTLLGYATMPFEFWRGGLVLVVQVVPSKFHTGRIAICTHYGRQSSDVVDINEAMSQYSRVIDVASGSTSHAILFPWKSPQEMLRIGLPASTLKKTETTMGQFSIRVLTQLRTQDSVAGAIDINLFWGAAKDFTVDFLRPLGNQYSVVNPYS